MNRKLVFITGLCALLAAAGCRQEEKELRIEKTEVRLHAGETLRIGSNIAAQWSSANEFTATVDSDGNVTGQHVGSVTVTAVAGSSRQECRVEVEPRYDTYIEPAYELFGKEVSFEDIDKIETRRLFGTDKNSVMYIGEKQHVKGIYYLFGIDKPEFLRSIQVHIERYYTEEVKKFLAERYFPVSESMRAFIDGYEEDATTEIQIVDVSDENIMVVYRPLKAVN